MRLSILFWVVAIFLLVHVASGAVYDVTFTPIMTNNTQPSGYIASASSEEYTRDAYNAFDRVNGDPEGTAWSTWQTGITTGWIQLQIPVGKVARNYTIWDKRWGNQQSIAAAQAPKVFNLSGSNNGVDWVVLDSRTNVTWNTTTWEGKSFEFENFVPYTYYRLNVLENNGNPSTLQIGEIYLYESKTVIAAFNTSATEGNETLWIDFTDISVGEPTSWSWQKKALEGTWEQFNTTQNPRYGFAAGNWSIRLNASNFESSNTSIQDTWINVTALPPNPPPPAYWFTSDVTWGEFPLQVSFESMAPNASRWTWFFGDEPFNQSWTKNSEHNHTTFSGRWQHQMAAFSNDTLIITGGYGYPSPVYETNTWMSSDRGTHWTLMNSTFPNSPEFASLVVVDNDTLVLMDGYSPQIDDVFRSTDMGATWTEVNSSPGWAYETHGHQEASAVVTLDGDIVHFGGWGNNHDDTADVWKSSDHGSTWTQVKWDNASEWGYRSSGGAAVLPNGNIIYAGGYGEDMYHDVWMSADEGASWTRLVEHASWPAREYLNLVSLSSGKLILHGGVGESYNKLNDTWESTDGGTTWTQLPNAPWPVSRGEKLVVLSDDTLVVSGGDRNVVPYQTNNVWVSTDEAHTWTQVQSNPSRFLYRESMPSVVMNDGSVIFMGGYGLSGGRYISFNDVWRSANNGETWTRVNASAGWAARYSSCAVQLSDDSIVLMGGRSGQSRLNDTWISTNFGTTWTLQNASVAWSGRYDLDCNVFSDDTIIVMGGHLEANNVDNDTWISNDKGITWTRQTANAPWWKRSDSSSVVPSDDSVILMGGNLFPCNGPHNCDTTDVWRSVDKGITWQLQNDSAWPPRNSQSVLMLPNDDIILTGGSLYDGWWTLNDTYRSTDYGVTWTRLSDPPWRSRCYQSDAVLGDGSILIIGGYGYDCPDSCYEYEYSDTWIVDYSGSHLENPTHIYTEDGTYDVTLQAINHTITKNVIKINYISDFYNSDVKPILQWIISRFTVRVPGKITVTDTSLNEPTTYEYTWGDGTTISTFKNGTHTYYKPGNFLVTHSASNSAGTNTSDIVYITVVR